MSSSGNAKTGPTGIVVDVDEYSASGSTMLKDIVKIIKSVFANHENATCSALSREVKVCAPEFFFSLTQALLAVE